MTQAEPRKGLAGRSAVATPKKMKPLMTNEGMYCTIRVHRSEPIVYQQMAKRKVHTCIAKSTVGSSCACARALSWLRVLFA